MEIGDYDVGAESLSSVVWCDNSRTDTEPQGAACPNPTFAYITTEPKTSL